MTCPNMRTAWLLVADALADVAEGYEAGEAVAYAVDARPGEWPAVAAAIRAMCGPDEDEAGQDAIDARLAASEGGAWVPCTGCCDIGECGGREADYPLHPTHGCRVGAGCAECNGRGIVLMVCGEDGAGPWAVDEDAPPPADVSLLASANRTLAAELEAVRQALVEWEVEPGEHLDGGVHSLGHDRERARDEIASLENDLEAARAEVERVTGERDEARWKLLALAERSDEIARRIGGVPHA